MHPRRLHVYGNQWVTRSRLIVVAWLREIRAYTIMQLSMRRVPRRLESWIGIRSMERSLGVGELTIDDTNLVWRYEEPTVAHLCHEYHAPIARWMPPGYSSIGRASSAALFTGREDY